MEREFTEAAKSVTDSFLPGYSAFTRIWLWVTFDEDIRDDPVFPDAVATVHGCMLCSELVPGLRAFVLENRELRQKTDGLRHWCEP